LLQAISKLALRAQTVDNAYLALRQGLLPKNVSMNCSKESWFGQQPVESLPFGPNLLLPVVDFEY
jgi:hypothetical protein